MILPTFSVKCQHYQVPLTGVNIHRLEGGIFRKVMCGELSGTSIIEAPRVACGLPTATEVKRF